MLHFFSVDSSLKPWNVMVHGERYTRLDTTGRYYRVSVTKPRARLSHILCEMCGLSAINHRVSGEIITKTSAIWLQCWSQVTFHSQMWWDTYYEHSHCITDATFHQVCIKKFERYNIYMIYHDLSCLCVLVKCLFSFHSDYQFIWRSYDNYLPSMNIYTL